MKKDYEQFLEELAKGESNGRYDIVNPLGYLGKYQMGELAFIDSGYYRKDSNKFDNRFSNFFWTGKDGIKSKQDFLNNHQAQENAIREYMRVQWGYILNKGLDRFVGKKVWGYFITVSGELAGAHLVGVGKLELFLKKGVIKRDGNNVPITTYIEKFSGYETPFKPRKKLTGLQKDKSRNIVNYQIDGKEWISRDMAIQMIKNWELDGVIVPLRNGTLFLRTPPDKTRENNLVG